MVYSRDLIKLHKEYTMSSSTMDAQILEALHSLNKEVHSLSTYLTRLDERMVALDQKVDNRVQSVEVRVHGIESRLQVQVDRHQDFEIKLNRTIDKQRDQEKDLLEERAAKANWLTRFVMPVLVAICIAALSSFVTFNVSK